LSRYIRVVALHVPLTHPRDSKYVCGRHDNASTERSLTLISPYPCWCSYTRVYLWRRIKYIKVFLQHTIVVGELYYC